MSATGAGAAATPKYTRRIRVRPERALVPGCGDYAVLSSIQKSMPDPAFPGEHRFHLGIGCSSRFPYYMNTYGFHTIHGRAPALHRAKVARPDLKIFVVTGRRDGLSIGATTCSTCCAATWTSPLPLHNRIYGPHQGQYSPTSELGKVTKSRRSARPTARSTRWRSPSAAAPRSWAARSIATSRTWTRCSSAPLRIAAAFLEILQNCKVYNDLAWNVLYDKESKLLHELRLPARPSRCCSGRPTPARPSSCRADAEGVDASGVVENALWIHDEKNINAAKLLADLFAPDFPVTIGSWNHRGAPSTRKW